MKSTPWRKPIGDCGGINKLIEDAYINQINDSHGSHCDVIVHAYREVGTSLESALEVRWYSFVGGGLSGVKVHKKLNKIEFVNWSC